MSGGVDSLKTAALLKQRGHDLTALHMRLLPDSPSLRWDAEISQRSREDRLKDLTAALGIPCHVVDLRAAFEAMVIQPFVAAYQAGLTPNPCTICNPRIKFGLLLAEARRMGAECLATGHYVRRMPADDHHPRICLQRGRDLAKDQSYFLYGLSQDQLAGAMFPLGEYFKQDVQNWAEEQGFTDQIPEESQEICFIPAGHYREFLEERLGIGIQRQQGDIIDLQGRVLGRHRGICGYTIGQRRGLGIASTAPLYVVALEPSSNRVVVGRAADLYRTELIATDVNWLSIAAPDQARRCQVRIRNQHQPAPATIIPDETGMVLVRFDAPQRAVTPGQAAVFYEEDVVLGGGIIGKVTDPVAADPGPARVFY
jgi:tRNA-uridine 2-sulfurtransferase